MAELIGPIAGCRSSDVAPSILLVEDEPTTRLILTRQLTRAGYDVKTASNGLEALAILRDRYFPLLLTDWDMPEMSGVALCKAVRELTLDGYVYTILLSARESKAHVVEGLAAGADDYLIKPPDDNELRARLNTGRRILGLEQSLRAATLHNYELSIKDVLTATYNRRYLMDQLPEELKAACLYGQALSVALCDVDHFKRVNDEHGHLAGDAVLKELAQLLMTSTRRDFDWVARYGGEEFLVVLPETTVQNAMGFADKMRRAIEGHTFTIPSGTLRVSSSFGVSGYGPLQTDSVVSVDTLIAHSDSCLYQSKECGRNRVTAGEIDANGIFIHVRNEH